MEQRNPTLLIISLEKQERKKLRLIIWNERKRDRD